MCAAPSEPEELTVDIGSITHKSLTLEWKPLEPSHGSSIQYVVEYKIAADMEFKNLANLSDTSYKVSQLTGNTEYCFRVAAVNSAGQGPYKNLVNNQYTSKLILNNTSYKYYMHA